MNHNPMRRPLHNGELMEHIMNYSKHGPLAQLIVLEGLRNYCASIVAAPDGFLGSAALMFDESAWRGCCQEILDTMANRDQLTVEVGQLDDEDDDLPVEVNPEKAGLLGVLEHLKGQGWVVRHVDDGEEEIDAEGKTLAEVIEDAAAVELAHIRLSRVDGAGTGTLMLVWGNSPIELIADATTNHGFDEALDAAQRSVWPNYPDEN